MESVFETIDGGDWSTAIKIVEKKTPNLLQKETKSLPFFRTLYYTYSNTNYQEFLWHFPRNLSGARLPRHIK